MKTALNIFLLFVINLIYPQDDKINDSTIVWNENSPLSWNDFKIKKNDIVKNGLQYGAGVSSSVKVDFKYNTKNNSYEYIINAVTYPYSSVSIVKYEDDYSLQHEQLHFDIVKLFAIKMEEEYKKYDNINDYRIVYDSIIDELDRTQALYDKETAHSILVFNQKIWEFKIHKALQKYGYYEEKVDANKCKGFQKGKYRYEFENDTAFIERKDSIQYVTYKQSGMKLKQKIKWLSDCTYLVYHTDYIFTPKYTNKFSDEKILVKVIKIENNVYKIERISDKYNEIHLLKVIKL